MVSAVGGLSAGTGTGGNPSGALISTTVPMGLSLPRPLHPPQASRDNSSRAPVVREVWTVVMLAPNPSIATASQRVPSRLAFGFPARLTFDRSAPKPFG